MRPPESLSSPAPAPFSGTCSIPPWEWFRRSVLPAQRPACAQNPLQPAAEPTWQARARVPRCRPAAPAVLRHGAPGGAEWRRVSQTRAGFRAFQRAAAGSPMRLESSNPGSLRSRSRAEKAHSSGHLGSGRTLLIRPRLCHADRQLANSLDHADALGDTDSSAGIERVKDVRAFENLIVGRQKGKPLFVRSLRIVRLQE